MVSTTRQRAQCIAEYRLCTVTREKEVKGLAWALGLKIKQMGRKDNNGGSYLLSPSHEPINPHNSATHVNCTLIFLKWSYKTPASQGQKAKSKWRPSAQGYTQGTLESTPVHRHPNLWSSFQRGSCVLRYSHSTNPRLWSWGFWEKWSFYRIYRKREKMVFAQESDIPWF